MKNEAEVRLKIDKMLLEIGWNLENDVAVESYTGDGFIDYLLLDSKGMPLAVMEAKRQDIPALAGKTQAEKYAKSKNCRFILLSNGDIHYFWDTEKETEKAILNFPTQADLESILYKEKAIKLGEVPIEEDFIVQSQGIVAEDDKRYLRDYQLDALKTLIELYDNQHKRKFLFEMATGTGKTLLSAAIIKLFLKSQNARRVLFVVDRLELADQAEQSLTSYLKEYTICNFRKSKGSSSTFNIVIATVQSLISDNNYRRYFTPFSFDVVISDEAHRSIYGTNRIVLEYFEAVKIGLTATPKNYLKGIDEKELSISDPRRLEKRIMRDTYKMFDCESERPTFSFSLYDAVVHKPPYLVNPYVMDKRSNITTKLLSEEGFSDLFQNEEGEEENKTFKIKDLEKKLFAEELNELLVKEFIKSAKKDPITGEIGKTIIYCINQNHAGKIAHLVNQEADKVFPGKYNGTFARQITSYIKEAQDLTKKFRNDQLGNTRVVTTVSMMTTGYDCPDLLNVVLMRPVFSPSEFVQIKGRGTRKYIFTNDITNERVEKDNFYLVDFFAVCEFFDQKYDYSAPLKINSSNQQEKDSDILTRENFVYDKKAIYEVDKKVNESKYFYRGIDGVIYENDYQVTEDCLKIDREMYKGKFEEKIKEFETENNEFKEAIKDQDFEKASVIVKENVLNKPEDYFTLESLREAYNSRETTLVDFIRKALGFINKFPTKYDKADEEFNRYKVLELRHNNIYAEREVFNNYMLNPDYRAKIKEGDYTVLSNPKYGGTIQPNMLSVDKIKAIVNYIDSNNIQR